MTLVVPAGQVPAHVAASGSWQNHDEPWALFQVTSSICDRPRPATPGLYRHLACDSEALKATPALSVLGQLLHWGSVQPEVVTTTDVKSAA